MFIHRTTRGHESPKRHATKLNRWGINLKHVAKDKSKGIRMSSDGRIPATSERVPLHTDAEVNEQIRTNTLAKIAYYKEHKNQIGQRLEQLEREWDTERLLEANASTLVVLGVTLGFTVSRNRNEEAGEKQRRKFLFFGQTSGMSLFAFPLLFPQVK